MSVRGWLAGAGVGVLLGGGMMWGQAVPPPGVMGGVVSPQATAAGPTGTVTGRVVAQDTQRAVRFAQVMLQTVASAQSDASVGERFGGYVGGGVSTRTDVSGSFELTGVTPGDYYVSAMAPGFIPLRSWLQEKVAAGADPAALLAGIPVVHVAADSTSSATVMLERGGVISGRVQWEDGSAAAGVSLSTQPATAVMASRNPVVTPLPGVLQGIQSAGGNASYTTTDDRGMFRLVGLTTGEYLLRATIQPPMQVGNGRGFSYSSPLILYAPGVFHRAEAKAINVREGDERSDVRMVIDLRGAHAVSGHVGSATAGVNVGSGTVTLADASDSSLRFTGNVSANGDFALQYVPAGNYTMTVTGSSRVNGGRRPADSSGTYVSFSPLTTPLVVGDGDVRGMGVSLTPVGKQ